MPIPLGILAVAGAGAGAAGSFDLLETTLISTNTASVTFSNLNNYSAYKHLQLRVTSRTNVAANVESVNVFFNNDTAANYAEHLIFGDGSSVTSVGGGSTDSPTLYVSTANNFTSSNVFAVAVIDILDFSNSSKNTTSRSFTGYEGSVDRVQLCSTLWNNTAAVTSIKFQPELGGSFVSGSRFSLYGVK